MSRLTLRDVAQAITDLDEKLRDGGEGPLIIIEGGLPDFTDCVVAYPGGWRWKRVAEPGESPQKFFDRVSAEAAPRGGRIISFGGLPPMPTEDDEPDSYRREEWWRAKR